MLLYKCGNLGKILDEKKTLENIEYSSHFKFSQNTTYRLGGSARGAYFPKNIFEVKILFKKILQENLKYVVLGCGSNILASNKFFDGVVISTKKLKGIVRVDKNTIFCLAGTTVNELINYCKNNLLGGLEFLVGIPASIAGLCYMNGGAGGNYIESRVKKVKLYDGKIVNLPRQKCQYGNKYCTMRDIKAIICGIYLSVLPKSLSAIEKNLRYYKSLRCNQPKGRSCGCVFKNTEGIPSGKLIDSLGLKGKRIGGAYVSYEHANFIIADGNCPQDVKALIDFIKKEAYEKAGVRLYEEVIYIGDFN
jgi:UDP-N-acetylmuramate dehydrogenase